MEKRAASAASEQIKSQPRHTAPQEIYPQMEGQQAIYDTFAQAEIEAPPRICPSCGLQVPGRSKVCPACGWSRLPPEKTRPIRKAEEFYKSRVAISEPYPVYNPPPADQYYGQPAAQPYEAMYTAPPVPMEQPYEGKKWRRERKPRETEDRMAGPRQKKSPLPLLFALLAFAGVIVLAAVFIMDQLKTPPPPVLPPATNPSTVAAKAPVISDVQYKDITKEGAVVAWKTDKKSNSIVVYCLDGGTQCESAKDDNLVTDHSVKLTGLGAGKSYHITVKSRLDDNPDSPDATKEVTDVLKTTALVDTTPPKITEVKVTNITSSTTMATAEITWKTDEPATSQVSYGTSVLYGSLQPAQYDTTLTTFHDVTLNGLPIQATIHYKVISRDAAGNEVSSSDATFVTPVPAGTAIGNSAPDFTLRSSADGNEVSLSSLRGKKVIINFWHTACGYCKAEMPHFQTIKQNNTENATILAIDTAATSFGPDNLNYVGDYLNQNGYTFTVLLDNSGAVGRAYNVTAGIPVTYFLDAQGIIRAFKDGMFPSASDIQAKLDSY